MINILSAIFVWHFIFYFIYNDPGYMGEVEESFLLFSPFLFLSFCISFIYSNNKSTIKIIKGFWIFWLGLNTYFVYEYWWPNHVWWELEMIKLYRRITFQIWIEFFKMVFAYILAFLTSGILLSIDYKSLFLKIDYKSLFLKLIITGSQFFNKNYKKFKKSQSANNFQPIEFKKLTKLYTHPKQIKWLVMLSILLIGFVMGFLIIFGDNYFTYFLLILLGIAFAYSGNILQSLEESQLDFTTNNFQHFFSTWMSNILYYFTLLLDNIPDIPDSKVQDKKPQKTSKSKKVKAKK